MRNGKGEGKGMNDEERVCVCGVWCLGGEVGSGERAKVRVKVRVRVRVKVKVKSD
jgi:hypothetical protein